MSLQSGFSRSPVLAVVVLFLSLAMFVGCAGIRAAAPGDNGGGNNGGGNNGGGSTPQPTIATFTAAPASVDAGQTATLTWTTQNATAVTLDGAAVDANGSKTVTVASTTTYTLAATGATGTTPANKTLTVSVNPKIVSFTAKPTTVGVGQSTTLTWETTGATSVTLNGDAVNAKGTADKVITQDTTFTLTANGGAQPVTQSVDVKATTASLKTSVNHIIMLMQENRSFDHYFGRLNNYRAKQGLPTDVDDLTTAEANKKITPNPSWCAYSPGSCTGPATITPFQMVSSCIEDLSSSWQEAHNDVNLHAPNQANWGATPPMNGFAAMAGGFADHTGGNDVAGKRAMGYYTGDQLTFYYWAATTFATSDRWFSGALTRTQPNRMYWLAATSNGFAFPGGTGDTAHPPMYLDNRTNIFQLLEKAGVSWKVYIPDDKYDANAKLRDTYLGYFYTFAGQHLDKIVPMSQYAADAAAGTLPAVAMIETGGHDEHPQDHIDQAMQWVWDRVNTLMNSPSWKDSIMIITYDEGGGLYDHVPPVSMPKPDDKEPILAAGDPTGHFDTTGFRVPLMVISPFTKPGYVSHTNADFTAVLKLIETRFDLPSLTARDAAQMDMTEFFDWTAPNLTSVNPPKQINFSCTGSLP